MNILGDPDKGPRSALARYAFGYSNKKPGAAFWLIHAAMVAFILYSTFH